MQSVVITGVSTGIGLASASYLVRKGFRVFGSVRRACDAEKLTTALGSNFIPLCFDVTDSEAIAQASETVREQLDSSTLNALVNNAGIAIAGPLLDLPVTDFQQQLEVNLVGQLKVTQAFAPLLGKDKSLRGKPGRIINISSISGVRAMPFMGAYAASKFGFEGFSEALRRELMYYNIDVIVIGPGPIQTPIWDKAEQIDIAKFSQSDYLSIMQGFQKETVKRGREGYPVEHMAEVIFNAITSKNPKVRYAVVKSSLLEKLIVNLAPKRFLDKIIANKLGLSVFKANPD